MDIAQALILTGPPGAGKTTVARLLAGRYERAVHLESDRFFRFIERGYIEPWRTESHEQNEVVMGIVGEAAARYARAGYFTMVDGILIPGWFLEPVRDSLAAASVPVSLAILRPPLAIALERSRERSADDLTDPDVVEKLWNSFSDIGPFESYIIDNEGEDPERTARTLAERSELGELALA